MILLDPTNLVATIRDSLRCQLLAKLSVELTDKQADDIARNVAQAVHGLEMDETVIVEVHRADGETNTIVHHDRCLSPFDDGHLTCPVVGGRLP